MCRFIARSGPGGDCFGLFWYVSVAVLFVACKFWQRLANQMQQLSATPRNMLTKHAFVFVSHFFVVIIVGRSCFCLTCVQLQCRDVSSQVKWDGGNVRATSDGGA